MKISYLVGYDLNRPRGEDAYPDLIAAIKGISPNLWWHSLDSTWIIKSELDSTQIRDRLRSHIDTGDELLVVRLAGEGAWAGLKGNGSSWLKENL